MKLNRFEVVTGRYIEEILGFIAAFPLRQV